MRNKYFFKRLSSLRWNNCPGITVPCPFLIKAHYKNWINISWKQRLKTFQWRDCKQKRYLIHKVSEGQCSQSKFQKQRDSEKSKGRSLCIQILILNTFFANSLSRQNCVLLTLTLWTYQIWTKVTVVHNINL